MGIIATHGDHCNMGNTAKLRIFESSTRPLSRPGGMREAIKSAAPVAGVSWTNVHTCPYQGGFPSLTLPPALFIPPATSRISAYYFHPMIFSVFLRMMFLHEFWCFGLRFGPPNRPQITKNSHFLALCLHACFFYMNFVIFGRF